MYNDLYEEVYNEGYMQAYLNEISNPSFGYRQELRLDKKFLNQKIDRINNKYGDNLTSEQAQAKQQEINDAKARYRSDRKFNHSAVRNLSPETRKYGMFRKGEFSPVYGIKIDGHDDSKQQTSNNNNNNNNTEQEKDPYFIQRKDGESKSDYRKRGMEHTKEINQKFAEEEQERQRQKEQERARQKQQNTNNQKKGLSKGAKIGIGAGVGAAAIGTGLAAYKLIKSNKKKKQAYEEYKHKGGKADYKTFKKNILKECYEILFENYDIILEMGLPLNDYDYMVLDEIYEDNLYDNYEEDYEDIYNEGYEAAILTESIFDEKGYTKYVAKCKAKGKTPLPFKEWKRNNIIKTVGASATAVGLTAGGLKVGSDYKNYKKGKEEIGDGNSVFAIYDNDMNTIGRLPATDFTKRDIINLGGLIRHKKRYNKNKFNKHAAKNKNFIPSDK